MLPVERLAHERHDRRAAAAEQDRVDRHAGRVLPLGGDRRALRGRRGEARVRVRGRRLGVRRPVVAVPVDQVRGRLLGHALPPDVAVVGQRAVGEDRVLARSRPSRSGSCRAPVPGATPKKPASGLIAYSRPSSPNFIQAMSSPIVSTFQPSMRRDQHREVGLAAGARERAGDVLDLALGRGELEDQHVLGHPALVAGHDRGDAQREALLAQQRVAAVARAVGPDLARLGEVDDVLARRCTATARPPRPRLERRADRVHAGHELAVVAEHVERACAHAGHDPHRDDDVGRVGELDADVATCRSRAGPSRTARRTSCGRASRPSKSRLERARASRRGRASCWSGRRPPRARSR